MATIYLGEPTGPRLRSLPLGRVNELNDWLTEALRNPPSTCDTRPVMGFTRALSTLAQRRGITFHFNGDRMRVRGEVLLGKNLPGCVGGSKRKVTVTDERSLVGQIGQAVEPYHERPWRDDYL